MVASFLSLGFRPFFLGAALWALVVLALWLGLLHGGWSLPGPFDPVSWHAHALLLGYGLAVLAGFLLTAMPNWTGRPPLSGAPLAALALLWLAGRLAVLLLPLPWLAAALDLAFPLVLFLYALREILAGRNWRNLPLPLAVLLLLLASLLAHLEGTAALGHRLALSVLLLLIALIGGRIVPAFTRNWLTARGESLLPAPFARFDLAVIGASALALLSWTFGPDARGSGVLLIVAALLQAARLSRWRGAAAGAEPLVLILHLAYAWIPLGLLLLGLAPFLPALPATSGLHALTVGAIGTMTLAVMTRATLGHTGRALTAGTGTVALYGAMTLAALLRILAPLWPAAELWLLAFAGLLWMLAFGLFLLLYGPALLGPSRIASP